MYRSSQKRRPNRKKRDKIIKQFKQNNKILKMRMQESEDKINTQTKPLQSNISVGVGQNELYLHRDTLDWKAIYMEGKFYLGESQNIDRLLQIQEEIEIQRQIAFELENKEYAESVRSYHGKYNLQEYSCVTEISLDRRKRIEMKAEKELEEVQIQNAKRIAQIRNKRKQEKRKENKNLIKMVNKDKEDLKSVKIERQQIQINNLLANRSLMMKATPIKDTRINQRNNTNHPITNIKQDQVVINNIAQKKQAAGVEQGKKQFMISSIIQIKIDEPQFLSPKKSVKQKSLLVSDTKMIDQPQQLQIHNEQNGHSPSILSVNSSIDRRIKQAGVRAGDNFFYQIHSKIDELENQISEIKSPMIYEAQKTGQKVEQAKAEQQRQRYRYHYHMPESEAMINTKNMLKDLNKQLRQIGLVEPEQDSQLTIQKPFNNISAINKEQVQINAQRVQNFQNQPFLQQLDYMNMPKQNNTHLQNYNQANILSNPQQKQIQHSSLVPSRRKVDCKLYSNTVNYQISQIDPKHCLEGSKEQSQKLIEQISVLKQVVTELKVQRLKYQVSQTKNQQQGTVYSNFYKTQKQTPVIPGKSHRVSASIFNNFTESAVSEVHTNQYRSLVTGAAGQGRIVKNVSPQRKMPNIEQQRKSDKYIKQEVCQTEQRVGDSNKLQSEQQQRNSSSRHNKQLENNSNHSYQNYSKDHMDKHLKNAQQLEDIKQTQSIKVKTPHQQPSQSNSRHERESTQVINLQFVTANNSQSVKDNFSLRRDRLGKFVIPLANHSLKNQSDMESSMPRPLNRLNNNSVPPKLSAQEHNNNLKKSEVNAKKKIIGNFEQMKANSSVKVRSIEKANIEPKFQAKKDGLLKKTDGPKIAYNSQINKVIINSEGKGEINNLKLKLIQIQQQKKNQASLQQSRKNSIAESKSSKGFRLRKGTQSSQKSSRSISAHKSNFSQGITFKSKKTQNNVYVPTTQAKDFGNAIDTPKQEDKMFYQIEIKSTAGKKYQKFQVKRRKIIFNTLKAPQFPDPPHQDISIQQMIDLIKKIRRNLHLQIREQPQQGIVMKKYKNCIMLDMPNQIAVKIVWHYNGKLYIGGWDESLMLKRGDGVEFVPEKYYYKGQFSNGKRHGSGVMIQPSGSTYQGQWSEGEKNGRGKYYDSMLKLNYEGQWKNGKRSGFGYLQIVGQTCYQGTFVDNYKDGSGTEQLSNGDSYKGQYNKGRFHGKGVYVWANQDYYDGEFYEGCKHGRGYWRSSIGQFYEGYYENDKKSGSGKYFWNNGCIYEGQFSNDAKNGNGILKYPDGKQIQGFWNEGKLFQVYSQINRTDSKQKPKISQQITVVKVVESTPKKIAQPASRLSKL